MLLQNILFSLLLLSCSAALSRDPFHSRLAFRNSFTPPTISLATEDTKLISVPITSDSNGVYADLSLGSDKHKYKMLVDTTYSWLTFMPQDTTSSSADQNLFNCALSQTCKTTLSDPTNIAYKSHSLACSVVEEQVVRFRAGVRVGR